MHLSREFKLASAIGLMLVAIGCLIGLITMALTMYQCPPPAVGFPSGSGTLSNQTVAPIINNTVGGVVQHLTTRLPTRLSTRLPIRTTAGSVFTTSTKSVTPSSAGQNKPQTITKLTTPRASTKRPAVTGAVVTSYNTQPTRSTMRAVTSANVLSTIVYTGSSLLTTPKPMTTAPLLPKPTVTGSASSTTVGRTSSLYTTGTKSVRPAVTTPSVGQTSTVNSNAAKPAALTYPRPTAESGKTTIPSTMIFTTTTNSRPSIGESTTTITPVTSTVASRGTTVTPRGTTVTPRGTTVTPRGTTVTPRGTTVTPRGTTVTPRGTTVTPRGTTVTPRGTTVTPRGNTVASRSTTPITRFSTTTTTVKPITFVRPTLNPGLTTRKYVDVPTIGPSERDPLELEVLSLSRSDTVDKFEKYQPVTNRPPSGKVFPLSASEIEKKVRGTTVATDAVFGTSVKHSLNHTETAGLRIKNPENGYPDIKFFDSNKGGNILKIVIYIEEGIMDSSRANNQFTSTQTFYVDIGMHKKGFLNFRLPISLNE